MKFIENQTFDRERALYGERNLHLKRCTFDGPADGESALKECCGIQVEDCLCNLRYPFWHDHGLKISGTELTPHCRAALWYSAPRNQGIARMQRGHHGGLPHRFG